MEKSFIKSNAFSSSNAFSMVLTVLATFFLSHFKGILLTIKNIGLLKYKLYPLHFSIMVHTDLAMLLSIESNFSLSNAK